MTASLVKLLVLFVAFCVLAGVIGASIRDAHRQAKKTLRRINHGKR